MKTLVSKLCCCWFCMIFFYEIHAQNIVQLSFYSPLISTADMKYVNNHLVVAQDGLLIFNVSDPSSKPKLIAQLDYPGDYAYNNAVEGHRAYMGHGNNGILAVYDISDFAAPVLRGSLAIPAASYYIYGDIEPYGNYVYVSGFDSIYVVDVSNSTAPVLANAFEVSHTEFSGAENMAITNNTLFVKTPFGIGVYSISDPVNPALLTTIPNSPLHPYVKELAVDTINQRLFIPWLTALQQFEGHDAYDVRNPAAPQFLFADSTSFGGGDFGISAYSFTNNVLYLSHGGGINAFDVSNATHGFVTSFTGEDIANASVSIQVRDSVFFNARGGGLEVLEYTDEIPAECNEPTALGSRVNGTDIMLAWKKVPGAKAYIVRYRQVNQPWNYLPSKDNVKRITGLVPNTLHYWEVASVCGRKFRSDFSLTERVTTGSGDAKPAITIAPNPVKDMFRVTINDPAVKQLIITDLSGNTLLRINKVVNGQQASSSKLIAGTYLVQAITSDGKIVAKTILVKE